MHPAATLFLDVCVQRDFWPDGDWPLVSPPEAERIARLTALAAELGIRRGGIVCVHGAGRSAAVAGAPLHCEHGRPGSGRPHGVALPPVDEVTDCASGCNAAPDRSAEVTPIFERLTAGIRDAVVFGAGVEHGIEQAVGALLRRRIRIHVALDAAAAADADAAQRAVALWKRRGVDGATVATIHRLLLAGGRN